MNRHFFLLTKGRLLYLQINLGFLGFTILAILFLVGCKPQGTAVEEPGDFHLRVAAPGLQLRETPGPEGKVLQNLDPETRLTDLGQVSSVVSRLRIAGQTYYEPWIRVASESGASGWVYAHAGYFSFLQGDNPAGWQLDKRLESYFGAAQKEAIYSYQADFEHISDLAGFVRVQRQGEILRDTLVDMLGDKVDQLSSDELPDLFWLEDILPGFVPQVVAEGTAYYLFTDFKPWLEKALKTPETEDEAYTNLCISFFPEDSVAYFYPAWQIQTWDYGGHSLLGRGHHLAALRGLDALFRPDSPLKESLLKWKRALLADITGSDVSYWETREVVLAELDQILEAGFGILNREDGIALQIRRQKFLDAEKSGVEFNHQSGVY